LRCTCEFGNPDHPPRQVASSVLFSKALVLLHSIFLSNVPHHLIFGLFSLQRREQLAKTCTSSHISPSDPVFHDINDIHISSVTISNIPSMPLVILTVGYGSHGPYKWMYTMDDLPLQYSWRFSSSQFAHSHQTVPASHANHGTRSSNLVDWAPLEV